MTDLRTTPKTSDGKQIVLLNAFPGKCNVAHPGAADGAGKWDGAPLRYECKESDTGEWFVGLEWQYNDWVYLAGGEVAYKGAKWGDELNYDIYAPATVATTPGDGFSKTPTGLGFNVFHPGNVSSIDLTKDAVPVPNSKGTGWFNWDPDTNVISVNSDQKGGYDLFDVPLPLSTFIPRLQVWGGTDDNPRTEEFVNPVVKPKRLLPQWKHRIKFWNTTDKSSQDTEFRVSWRMFVGRLDT